MQRVLTFPMFQRENQASETVNKRLCCSFLLTTAFLSIVGGFLLGRYVTERAIYVRQSKAHHDENTRTELLQNLAYAARNLTLKTQHLLYVYEDELYHRLQCKNYSPPFPDVNKFKTNVQNYSYNILNLHIQSLIYCFNNVSIYISKITP